MVSRPAYKNREDITGKNIDVNFTASKQGIIHHSITSVNHSKGFYSFKERDHLYLYAVWNIGTLKNFICRLQYFLMEMFFNKSASTYIRISWKTVNLLNCSDISPNLNMRGIFHWCNQNKLLQWLPIIKIPKFLFNECQWRETIFLWLPILIQLL